MTPVQCFCCCPASRRDDLAAIAQRLYPRATCTFTESAIELRQEVICYDDGACAVLAGFSMSGVSDINLCAALVCDGCAAEVILVVDKASGSLLSRANSAGVTRVIEAGDDPSHPVRETEQHNKQLRTPTSETARDGSDACAPSVVFCSGRGGVGKTSLAAVTACIAASWGMRVGLVDLDLANGNLYSCFGLKRGGDLAQIDPEDEQTLAGQTIAIGAGIELWGPCRLPEMAEVASAHTSLLLEHARSRADLVLVDTSSTTTDAVAEALQDADRVVLVYDGRVSSLASLARMGSLAVRLGVARTRIMRLENHADPYEKPDFAFGRAEEGLEVARPLRVFEGGGEVAQMLGEGLAEELSGYSGDYTGSAASCLAQVLVELGCLPSCEDAQRAAREPSVKRRIWPFARAREAS